MSRRARPILLAEILDLAARAEAAGQAALARDLTMIAGRMDRPGPGNYDGELRVANAYSRGLMRACQAARKTEPKGILR
jgi:hypothetical protein